MSDINFPYQRDSRGHILYYKVNDVICLNCNKYYEVKAIPKGTPLINDNCEECGCKGFLIKQKKERNQ